MRRLVKRALALAVAVCLSMALLPGAVAAEGEVERGVLTYSTAIEARYEDACSFSGGLAAVKKDGKWGFIDYSGNTVIPFEYDIACSFSEGLAIVGELYSTGAYEEEAGEVVAYNDYRLGFIDMENNLTWFTASHADDTAASESAGEGFHLLRVRADAAVSGSDCCFHNGYVCLPAADESGYYLYGTDGHAEDFGLSSVSYCGWQVTEGWVITGNLTTYTGSQRYLNTGTGQYLKINYDPGSGWVDLQPFNQGLAPVWLVDWSDNWLLGFINTDGQWVIQPQYTAYWRSDGSGAHEVFGETGLAVVANAEGLYGAIDKTGSAVIPFQYEDLMPYSYGLAGFKQDGLYGFLDADGNVAIAPRYQRVTSFGASGYAVAYDGENASLIDTTGNPIPGADNLDAGLYFRENSDGSVTLYAPGEYVVIEEDGRYGFGRVSYAPALPGPGELNVWAYEAVCAAIEEGLIPTELQNLYRNSITRGEFCSLIVQAIETVLQADIEDVVLERTGKPLADWRSEYPFQDTTDPNAIAASALGVVTGYGDRVFDPYTTISREQAAVMLTRAAGVMGMDTDGAGGNTFTDDAQMSGWAREAVSFISGIGVMNGIGDGSFFPQGAYSREQSFVTVYRLFQVITGQQ